MKRLSGWDAVLLYSETPNVHMHTLKVAVIELDADRRDFGIEAFRRVIHSRLYKLEPFCYQLVDIPLKMHHPMWRENCDVDLTYHVRPWRLSAPGGRRELDEAIGEIASTPLNRDHPLWEMYFVEGLADDRIAVVGKVHHALADGVAAANLLARGMDLAPGPQSEQTRYAPDPTPIDRGAGAVGVCRSRAPYRANPGDHRLHREGHQPGAPQLTQAVTGADDAVHPAADVHEPHGSLPNGVSPQRLWR